MSRSDTIIYDIDPQTVKVSTLTMVNDEIRYKIRHK